MKRVTVSYRDLLRDLIPRGIMDEDMAAAVGRVLAEGNTVAMRETAQWVIRSLLSSGRLEVLERVPEGSGFRMRIREPGSNLRFTLRLDEPETTDHVEVLPLPLDPAALSIIRVAVVRQILLDQNALVLTDRVAAPREMVRRLEATMRNGLEIESVVFRALDQPPGEFWGTVPPAVPEIPESRLRDLGRSRNYMLYVRDGSRVDPLSGASPRIGSALYIGIGDEVGGWRAVVELRDSKPDAFSEERMSLGVLLCQHFQSQLASSARLQSMIFVDFLTGLYNRSYFEDQLEKQVSIAQRRKQSLGLCIVDIDGFKNFNTLYGYEGGDRVLVTVGCVLKAALRTSDTLARYGGEEFVALLAPPVGRERARGIAERLRVAVESEPFQVPSLGGGDVSERISVSVGGSLFPDHAENARDLWTTANRMLLEAKKLGKNRVCFMGDQPNDPAGAAGAR